MDIDEYNDRLLARHMAEEAAKEAYTDAFTEAVEGMMVILTEGEDVRYGTLHLSMGPVPAVISVDDVKEEINGEELRAAVLACDSERARTLWLEAARRLCEHHGEERMKWLSSL